MSEELGDLLCQVLFHATLAEEEGLFNLAEVARNVHDKLVARHPHVFGDVTATTAGAVLANWERNKQAEKKRTHLFEGIPAAMPALARAAKAERKLASLDLGWPATGLDAGSLVGGAGGHVGAHRSVGPSDPRHGRRRRLVAAGRGEARRPPGRGPRGARSPGARPPGRKGRRGRGGRDETRGPTSVRWTRCHSPRAVAGGKRRLVRVETPSARLDLLMRFKAATVQAASGACHSSVLSLC